MYKRQTFLLPLRPKLRVEMINRNVKKCVRILPVPLFCFPLTLLMILFFIKYTIYEFLTLTEGKRGLMSISCVRNLRIVFLPEKDDFV